MSESRQRVVLFLDLDGVLHRQGDSRFDDRAQLVGERLFRWWPELEAVLGAHPDVDVVIHSSWRYYWPNVESLAPLLPPGLAARVVGVTDCDVFDRHRSIEKYLENHPEVAAYVILDDERQHFPNEFAQLVVCDPRAGLSDVAVVQKLRRALDAAGQDAAKRLWRSIIR